MAEGKEGRGGPLRVELPESQRQMPGELWLLHVSLSVCVGPHPQGRPAPTMAMQGLRANLPATPGPPKTCAFKCKINKKKTTETVLRPPMA